MQNLLLLISFIVLPFVVEGFTIARVLGSVGQQKKPFRLHILKPKPMWPDYNPPTVIVPRTDFDTRQFKSEMPTNEDIIFLMHKHWQLDYGWYTGIELTVKHFFTRTRPMSVTDTASILFYSGKFGILDCRTDPLNVELHTKLFNVMFNDSVVQPYEFVEAMSGFGSCHFRVHEDLNLTGWFDHLKKCLPQFSGQDLAIVLKAASQMGIDKSALSNDMVEVLMSKLVKLGPELMPSESSSTHPGADISLAMSTLGFEAIDLGNEVRASVLKMTSNALQSVSASVVEDLAELVPRVMNALAALSAMKFKKFDFDDVFLGSMDQALIAVMPVLSEEQLLTFLQM